MGLHRNSARPVATLSSATSCHCWTSVKNRKSCKPPPLMAFPKLYTKTIVLFTIIFEFSLQSRILYTKRRLMFPGGGQWTTYLRFSRSSRGL